jgi:hypothetical protein
MRKLKCAILLCLAVVCSAPLLAQNKTEGEP